MRRPACRASSVSCVTMRKVVPFLSFIARKTFIKIPENFKGQDAGSLFSYLRRYAIAAVANIATSDDDGEAEIEASKAPLMEHLIARYDWLPIFEGENIIALTRPDGSSITLEPGGQLELSGAPLETIHQTCAETTQHLEQVKDVAKSLKVGFLGPEGTFTQAAVQKHFGHSVRAIPLSSIEEVFREVESAAADFGVVNGKDLIVSGTGDTYTVTVTADGQGDVSVAPSADFSVADPAGNETTTAGGTDRIVAFDSVKPVVMLEQAAGQADPTSTPTISFSLTSGEALDPSSVTASDFTTNNGVIAVSGSGSSYTITVTAATDGTVTIAPSGTSSVSSTNTAPRSLSVSTTCLLCTICLRTYTGAP